MARRALLLLLVAAASGLAPFQRGAKRRAAPPAWGEQLKAWSNSARDATSKRATAAARYLVDGANNALPFVREAERAEDATNEPEDATNEPKDAVRSALREARRDAENRAAAGAEAAKRFARQTLGVESLRGALRETRDENLEEVKATARRLLNVESLTTALRETEAELIAEAVDFKDAARVTGGPRGDGGSCCVFLQEDATSSPTDAAAKHTSVGVSLEVDFSRSWRRRNTTSKPSSGSSRRDPSRGRSGTTRRRRRPSRLARRSARRCPSRSASSRAPRRTRRSLVWWRCPPRRFWSPSSRPSRAPRGSPSRAFDGRSPQHVGDVRGRLRRLGIYPRRPKRRGPPIQRTVVAAI